MRRPELPLHPRWLRLSAIVGLGLLLTVVVWWPMFKHYPGTPIEDGHWFFYQIEVSKVSILRYHEMPLWNPFDCKGIPMWDHPENITASPIFYLTLPFKTSITVMVWHVAHVVVGFLGCWLLCRDDLKLSRAATFVAACAWSFGVVHNQYAGEHMAFVSFYHAPLLLFAWRRAEHSWNWAVGTGLLLALMIYDGATYPLPLTVVFLGVESLTRLTNRQRILRIAACGAIVGLVIATVGASRILPLQDQFAAHDRALDDVDHLARVSSWIDMYLLRSPHWRAPIPGQQYVFGEYMAYIGWLGLLLLLIGFGVAAVEQWWLTFIVFVLVMFMLGQFAKWAPWSFLHAHVPPFKSMRVPSRFRLLLALPLSLFMAFAIDRCPAGIQRWLGQPGLARATRVALFGLGVFAASDSAGLFTEILEVRFLDPAPAVGLVPSTRFYYGGPGLSGDYANHPRQNRGWLGCRGSWGHSVNANLWAGDVPQARATDDRAVIEVANRTLNTFTIDVEAREGTRILINSGFDRGWQTDVGAVVNDRDQLALDIPAGHHRVHLKYWPRRLTLGIWISVFGLLASLAFLFREDLLRRSPSSGRARRAPPT